MTQSIPRQACLDCGAPMELATGVTGKGVTAEPKAKPGDYSICVRCGYLMVFDGILRLRHPTIAERAEALKTREVAAVLAAHARMKKGQPGRGGSQGPG